jgi:hypothetical protein
LEETKADANFAQQAQEHHEETAKGETPNAGATSAEPPKSDGDTNA